MFDTPETRTPETTTHWYLLPRIAFACFTGIGVLGVLISFFKHGIGARVGLFSYIAVLVVALYFFLNSRNRVLTPRQVSARCLFLFALGMLPMWVKMLLM
jgi:hypothetical protein